MKTVSLIHTVLSAAQSFESKLRASYQGELCVYNLWDEFLIRDAHRGRLTDPSHKKRLLADLKAQEETGADLICITCSSLSFLAEELKPCIDIPLFLIDEALCTQAVHTGSRLLILASAESALLTLEDRIRREAHKAGKNPAILTALCAKAYDLMRKGDIEGHDRLILEQAASLPQSDCIVLAQVSMSHLAPAIEKLGSVPCLSSLESCIRSITAFLENI